MNAECSENVDSSKLSGADKLIGGSFLFTVAGLSMLSGFGMAVAMAKKRDPSFFLKGMSQSKDVPESGGQLAMRALGWGTLYAVSGFSLFCYSVWKILGVNNLYEFRLKMGNLLPKIPKHESQGRSDFRTLRELVEYITEEGKNK